MKPNVFMFVNYTPRDKSIGITKKIEAEIDAFRKLGYSVTYSAYIEDGVGIFSDDDELMFSQKYRVKNKKYQSLKRYFLLVDTCQKYIDSSDVKFELCYGRLSAPTNSYIKLLSTMKSKGMRTIIEAHAYFPGIKFKSLKGKYIAFMLEKNSKKLKSCVDRFLTEGHIDDFYGVPTKETRVGVATEKITPHKYLGNKEVLNLISVANETVYHAYDRIIRSIAEYKKKDGPINVKLHLVGTVSDATKKLINDLGASEYVILYGKQYGEKLDDIYNACNMGVGPLGQHRIGGKKDTGLKTKEYFAKGLPYFYSGNEMDILRGYPYICEVPSDESLISIEDLWRFYNTYSNNDNVVGEMRAFAQKEFSWPSIIKQAISD